MTKLASGLGRRPDKILADIIRSAKAGFFDKKKKQGPSKLEQTPTEELLPRLKMMSKERRWTYLAEIGNLPPEEIRLSGTRDEGEGRYGKGVKLADVARSKPAA